MTGRLLLMAATACGLAAGAVEWPVADPAALGFDPARLEAARQNAASRHTRALLVARYGKIALEWYAEGNGPQMLQGTASLAKALVGGMSLLVALNDGRMRPDDRAAQYIPRWRSDPRKSRITIRELATHTSGIEDAEQDGIPHMELPGWKGAFWKRRPDPISVALDNAPVLFEPGTANHYSNPGMAALAYAVTAGLRGAPEPDMRAALGRIYGAIGIPGADWSISYGESYELDGLRVYANWGGAAFTPRAVARIGQFMLQKGMWEGRQVLRREWVERMVAYAGMPKGDRTEDPAPASGLCWYNNYDGVWPGVPRDAFSGSGADQQALLVVPSLGLVVVRNGRYLGPQGARRHFGDLVEHVFAPVVASISAEPAAPYPPSPAIRNVAFDPPAGVVRAAPGSDNWPLTWADDGDIYTAYGDGWGFEPLLKQKLSLGLARVGGHPPAFRGLNIRSATAERTGDGAKGPKASGMLMVAGVLYMWVRNVGNSQLAWSEDHGRTWQWGFKFQEGFGAPAFLNFGKNHAGARDGYVYAYSQDGPGAYESYDGVALARAPRGRIREREAWRFFSGLDEGGRPTWTPEISGRAPAFAFPGHCQRVDAAYHPASKRYLLAVGYNHESGWGIYDAPEPWGPWTCAFHTEKWDLPGTHGYRLPVKWMDRGGFMYVVFSGVKDYDAFCVRRLTMEVR